MDNTDIYTLVIVEEQNEKAKKMNKKGLRL